MTQTDIDELTRRISRMDIDTIMCIAVNSLIQHGKPSKLLTLKRIANILVSASALLDENTKGKAIEMLRDTADVYEHALMVMKKG
jgi:hypothetical protein